MRKAVTRGLINRSFREYKGVASVYDPQKNKRLKVPFKAYAGLRSTDPVERVVEKWLPVRYKVLIVDDLEEREVTLSMTDEDFILHAKEY